MTIVKPKKQTVSKGKLKAKMLEYFRKIEETGEILIVTNNNIPVLEIRPIKKKISPKVVFSDVREKVKYYEDILTPTLEEWDI